MGLPQERLPERRDEVLAPGARLQVTLNERSGTSLTMPARVKTFFELF